MAKKVTKHLPITLTVRDIATELDRLALDDWDVVDFFPLTSNIKELGDDGEIFFLLKREVKL